MLAIGHIQSIIVISKLLKTPKSNNQRGTMPGRNHALFLLSSWPRPILSRGFNAWEEDLSLGLLK